MVKRRQSKGRKFFSERFMGVLRCTSKKVRDQAFKEHGYSVGQYNNWMIGNTKAPVESSLIKLAVERFNIPEEQIWDAY